jgi:aspartate aminotransferase
MPLASRLDSLSPTAVNMVLREIRARTAAGHDVVSLVRGQPDTPTPGHIVEAAQRALKAGRTGYPDNLGEPALRQAVAARLERDHGVQFDPEREILITDGATGGLFAAFGTLLNPGDGVLVPDPIYDAYAGPISAWGGRVVRVRSQLTSGRFVVRTDDLQAALTPECQALLLNSPWNPTGTVFTEAELRELVEFAKAHDLWVVSDEIYETLVYGSGSAPSAARVGVRNKTLLVNSLSKTYAMTGFRVGYVAGPAEVIGKMFLVWQQFSRGPATFVQDAAVAALTGDQSCTRRMADEYRVRRDGVVNALSGIPGVRPIVPEGGLFVMLDVREKLERSRYGTSDELRKHLLLDHGVAVIHGAAYGPGGEGTLRVSFAAGGSTLERGLERLQAALK